MMAAFVKQTLVVLFVLGAVVAIAWLRASRVHFVGLSAVCYGFLIGWLCAWVGQYSSRCRLPG
jgi:predicted benzoate:H+ symporter BenE